MIISASRRTDLPAFYPAWLLRRLQEGFCLVPNPLNPKQVSRVSLSPQDVDAIVFWTKNPAPLLNALPELVAYPYYFQFTLTPYGKNIEPGLPAKRELVETFQTLSRQIGRERVVWRYDPILLTAEWNVERHARAFREMMAELAPYTDTCVLSFVDLYRKTERNTRSIGLLSLTMDTMREIAARFADIAAGTGVRLQSCAEELDLARVSIKRVWRPSSGAASSIHAARGKIRRSAARASALRASISAPTIHVVIFANTAMPTSALPRSPPMRGFMILPHPYSRDRCIRQPSSGTAPSRTCNFLRRKRM